MGLRAAAFAIVQQLSRQFVATSSCAVPACSGVQHTPLRLSNRIDCLIRDTQPIAKVRAFALLYKSRTQSLRRYHHEVYNNFIDDIWQGGVKNTMPGTGTPSSTSNSGVKRKKGPPAFYAVKVGHEPGLYLSWDDTRRATAGFKNAVYKKFNTIYDAEDFLRNDSVATPATPKTTTPKSGKPKFYGVQAGHKPGVYTEWSVVQDQVRGFKGGKQKGFATHEEAEAYVNQGKRGTPSEASVPPSLKRTLDPSTPSVADRKPAKKQKRNDGSAAFDATNGDYEPGTGPIPADAEDGFDRTIKLQSNGTVAYKTDAETNAHKRQATGDFEGELKIWTDGAAKGNGRVGAFAGFGVWFGPEDESRNVSEPLLAEGKQTNQRAELFAINRAVDIAPIDRSALIYTDSYYSIKCLTEWFQKWERNEWKSASGKAVENRDIIEPTLTRIREREKAGAYTKFQWIKGHGTDEGNVGADRLASEGCFKSREAVHALTGAPDSADEVAEQIWAEAEADGQMGDELEQLLTSKYF
ncbi:hypothetical protein P280DRAFT_469309 [Massarina eburnea CBS 473.64]|uniref:ribonuclease H n=1 Tax=Massarina eburnea CBS 473.64 TaxID=1395130 RepID=A0A6A6RYC2_9PLEO|nr:hypothetical protein P280DRAFT_469309 [Massarina eburnea CBS 473.64]